MCGNVSINSLEALVGVGANFCTQLFLSCHVLTKFVHQLRELRKDSLVDSRHHSTTQYTDVNIPEEYTQAHWLWVTGCGPYPPRPTDGAAVLGRSPEVVVLERSPEAVVPEKTPGAVVPERSPVVPEERNPGAVVLERSPGAVVLERSPGAVVPERSPGTVLTGEDLSSMGSCGACPSRS